MATDKFMKIREIPEKCCCLTYSCMKAGLFLSNGEVTLKLITWSVALRIAMGLFLSNGEVTLKPIDLVAV